MHHYVDNLVAWDLFLRPYHFCRLVSSLDGVPSSLDPQGSPHFRLFRRFKEHGLGSSFGHGDKFHRLSSYV